MMTKGEMIASIQTSLKWAIENDSDAFDWMLFVIADYGFRTVSGWKWFIFRKMIVERYVYQHKSGALSVVNFAIPVVKSLPEI